jgi:hypothetical protein
MMMYPDRRSASTRVPYSQTKRMGSAMRFEAPLHGHPAIAKDVVRKVKRQEEDRESRDTMINIVWCFTW